MVHRLTTENVAALRTLVAKNDGSLPWPRQRRTVNGEEQDVGDGVIAFVAGCTSVTIITSAPPPR